jgi:hypothetical protein
LFSVIYAALFYFVLEASRMLRRKDRSGNDDHFREDGFVPLIEQDKRKEVPPQYAI